jgi:glutaredoxin-related protein
MNSNDYIFLGAEVSYCGDSVNVVIYFKRDDFNFDIVNFPPLADLEYILKFAHNATWWFIEVAPLR